MSKDSLLCKEGDDFAACFFVVGGQVRVTRRTPSGESRGARGVEGDEKVIAVLGPGAVLGTELLQDKNLCLYTAKTTANTLLWSLTRDTYKTYLTVGGAKKNKLTASWTPSRWRRRRCTK